MGEAIVAVTAIFCVFALPVFAFVVARLLSHRERMMMIRQGLAPADVRVKARAATSSNPMGHAYGPVAGCDSETARTTLRKGITLAFIGFALTIGLSFIGYSDGTVTPGPWLLGGLVPMFVGIAQVVIALLSDRTLLAGASARTPSEPFGDVSPPSPPTYDASYTYRPGSTQELRPPTAPPERRS